MKAQNTLIPFIVLLVAVLIAVASFFLPYSSVTAERREMIDKYPDEMFVQELGMTSKDAADMSLMEYFNVYSYMAGHNQSVEIAITCVVMICVVAFFTLLTVLFVCLRKAVPTIVFSLLDLGVFFLLGADFQMRGVIGDGKTYTFAIAYYLFIAALIVIFAAAIWLLVVKMKNKKANKEQTVSVSQ